MRPYVITVGVYVCLELLSGCDLVMECFVMCVEGKRAYYNNMHDATIKKTLFVVLCFLHHAL
jgi:hypothetical protein